MDFIEHPSYSEQKQVLQSILSFVTTENIDRLLKPLGLQCRTFQQLTTSGCVNILYELMVEPQTTVGISSMNLILKIGNPHRYWQKCRTKNEVYLMMYVREHTNIPIPKVLDYSFDAETSVLHGEYILMEKVQGITLEKAKETMPDYERILQKLKLPSMDQIGSFCSPDMALGGCIIDGPTLGPFRTWTDFIINHLQWSIKRIQSGDTILVQLATHLVPSLQGLIERVKMDTDLRDMILSFHLKHTDLNPSNILVDPENPDRVVAILDWERAAMMPTSINANCQTYLNVMYPAMYATFYSCTWFKDEETVNEHIKIYAEETEKALEQFHQS